MWTARSLAALLALQVASAHQKDQRPCSCSYATIPITVKDIPSIVVPGLPVQNQFQATQLLNIFTRQYAEPPPAPKLVNLTATYNISLQYCTAGNKAPTTLQILTHGVGFDKSYWDFYPTFNSSDSQYSYVAAALEANPSHAILFYDRLGIFPSTVPDPDTEVQSLIQLDILRQLTSLGKKGSLPYQQGPPAKIVHVGHSYGSALTNALVATYPDMSDGIVLTGFSHFQGGQAPFLAAFGFVIANQNDSSRWPVNKYPNGYVTIGTLSGLQYDFFAYPSFSPAFFYDVNTKSRPASIAELATLAALNLNATAFKGPVLWVNGEQDQPFCAGNCTITFAPGSDSLKVFTNAASQESVIARGFGHGINLHLGVKANAYNKIGDWVKRKGF